MPSTKMSAARRKLCKHSPMGCASSFCAIEIDTCTAEKKHGTSEQISAICQSLRTAAFDDDQSAQKDAREYHKVQRCDTQMSRTRLSAARAYIC